jgi:hypothetical protein
VLASLLGVAAVGGGGCAVKLIGDYDDVIDRSVTTFYESTEEHFARLVIRAGTPDSKYAANVAFYEQAQARLSVIRLRAATSPRKQLLVAQVDLLSDSVEKLRQLHASAGDQDLPSEALQAARTAITVHVESILKLELALKRGG